MLKNTMIITTVFCLAFYARSEDLSTGALISKLQMTGKQIAGILKVTENEFAARQALPRLQKLSTELTRLNADFSARLKADPTSLIRFSSDVAFTMNELKTALRKFNANGNIPFELRQKVVRMLKIIKI